MDGRDSILVYSRRGARIRNIQANPRVTVNFDGDGRGDDIVVLAGRATVDRDAPGADRDDAYLEKYGKNVERTGLSLEAFAARFPVPVRIRFFRLYGHSRSASPAAPVRRPSRLRVVEPDVAP